MGVASINRPPVSNMDGIAASYTDRRTGDADFLRNLVAQTSNKFMEAVQTQEDMPLAPQPPAPPAQTLISFDPLPPNALVAHGPVRYQHSHGLAYSHHGHAHGQPALLEIAVSLDLAARFNSALATSVAPSKDADFLSIAPATSQQAAPLDPSRSDLMATEMDFIALDDAIGRILQAANSSPNAHHTSAPALWHVETGSPLVVQMPDLF
ncbi:hypothetical protein, variant [Fonticula alba]|nr:hypothetical protein, variant [Fonticula alba]KCV71435.1 hypothetical protein, variant [Fonticula alba]|eukprot:XP_009494557.1 hypothetical protein, variant [Fonticula alba]